MPGAEAAAASASEHVRRAFAEEELRGLRIATVGRLLGLGVIAVWVTIENAFPGAFFVYPFLAGFAATGLVHYELRRRGRERLVHRLLFPVLDYALLVVVVLAPNPFDDLMAPAPMRLQYGNEIYLFFILSASVFGSSPAIVLWSGVAGALVWSAGVLWVLAQPGAFLDVPADLWAAMTNEERIRAATDPNLVRLGPWIRLVVVLLLVAATLASAVQRLRRLVLRQAEAERERTNLSRYFSPNVVEELARADRPLGKTRRHDVAVLFVDLVGFTARSEGRSPEDVMALLRDFHARIERVIFDHAGTLDKYVGDGVMATFGTPEPAEGDATRALRAARAMLTAVDAWNEERRRTGDDPLEVAIGLHYGPATVGAVGSEQRPEFTVVGDTVNVASRLERATRDAGVRLLVSHSLLTKARTEPQFLRVDESGLEELAPVALRGRGATLRVSSLR